MSPHIGDHDDAKGEGQYVDDKMHGLWYEYYGRELLEIDLYSNDSLQSIVYRNKSYPNRNNPLPDLNIDCALVRRHIE